MVLDQNAVLNLTRITEPEEMLRLHIIDSLLFMRHIEALVGPVVDIGSGAGYPGIPVAVATRETVTLCESVGKKARFLESSVADLGVDCPVYTGRAESLAVLRPAFYRTVIARAVTSLPSLVELASPLLSDGGRLVALKGTPEARELEAGRGSAEICGMVESALVPYELPVGGERRTVLEYRKVGEPKVALPRRPGQAQRCPLVSI